MADRPQLVRIVCGGVRLKTTGQNGLSQPLGSLLLTDKSGRRFSGKFFVSQPIKEFVRDSQ